MSEMRADVVVVGLGAVGAAALYQLAKRGVSAVGIDRFAPPHTMGSSHGETRITRQAVGEGRSYVPFVLRSHEIWRELEAETGEALFAACGAVVIGPGSGDTSHHGHKDFVGRSADAARAFAVPHEMLDGAEVARRFPYFVGLRGDEIAYYEPGGGYVRPERCVAAQLRRAGELGAVIRTGETVRAIRQDGRGVAVETDRGTVRAGRAICAAGAWNAALLGAPFDRLLKVSRQVLHWFALEPAAAMPENGPVFIWMHGRGDSDYLYGFPRLAGEGSVKVATEQYASVTSPETVDRQVSPAESAEMFARHVRGRIAGATGAVERTAACLYTVTPDRGFIIDQHPDMDRVTAVSACSGHGFKHSAGIGEAVAVLAAMGRSPVDLAPFRVSRFG
ncbi:N-methyl-L-tryptophan oxidase [Enterovirga sp.]|uniref:N-methyl-L-tryptophan oxidase n=1 Tax=Enterovirga sp. TaxID=2026350 RepID=UPI0026082C31|nr:N-methyl-L-tryptophan oxidase [Enterovirga sp.]